MWSLTAALLWNSKIYLTLLTVFNFFPDYLTKEYEYDKYRWCTEPLDKSITQKESSVLYGFRYSSSIYWYHLRRYHHIKLEVASVIVEQVQAQN